MEKNSILNALDEYADKDLAGIQDLRQTVLSQVQKLNMSKAPGEFHSGEEGNMPLADFGASSNSSDRTKGQAAVETEGMPRLLPKQTKSLPEVNPQVRRAGSWRSPAFAASLLLILGSVLVAFFASSGERRDVGLGIEVPQNPNLVVREIALKNLDFESGLAGWPSNPTVTSDSEVAYQGEQSATIAADDPNAYFGTTMRSIDANEILGERIRLSGYLKTKDVRGLAQLQLSVLGPAAEGRDYGAPVAFDNMSERPVNGTQDWKRYELVVDVPDNATEVMFGPWLWGTGQMWVDDLKLEVVSSDTPSTDMYLNSEPANLGFEDGLARWHWSGEHAHNSQLGVDSEVSLSGNASGRLNVTTESTDEVSGLEQVVNPKLYAGKRIRFSAYLKMLGIEEAAGLEISVDNLSGDPKTQTNLVPSNAHGITDWAKYEVTIDVPTSAYLIRFGPRIQGKGSVWIDNAQIEIVGDAALASPLPSSPAQTPGPTKLR